MPAVLPGVARSGPRLRHAGPDLASDRRARTPAVMAVWEPMGAVMESMDIAKVERLR